MTPRERAVEAIAKALFERAWSYITPWGRAFDKERSSWRQSAEMLLAEWDPILRALYRDEALEEAARVCWRTRYGSDGKIIECVCADAVRALRERKEEGGNGN